jgi:hypothetical protein
MSPLKPCPFCLTEGAKLIELWDLFDAGIVAHIHCEHCGADGPSIYCEVGGVDAALARARSMWNGRAVRYETPNVGAKRGGTVLRDDSA